MNEEENNKNEGEQLFDIKLTFGGDYGSGKSSIINRFVNKSFYDNLQVKESHSPLDNNDLTTYEVFVFVLYLYQKFNNK